MLWPIKLLVRCEIMLCSMKSDMIVDSLTEAAWGDFVTPKISSNYHSTCTSKTFLSGIKLISPVWHTVVKKILFFFSIVLCFTGSLKVFSLTLFTGAQKKMIHRQSTPRSTSRRPTPSWLPVSGWRKSVQCFNCSLSSSQAFIFDSISWIIKKDNYIINCFIS